MSPIQAVDPVELSSQAALHPYFVQIVKYARTWEGLNYKHFARYLSPRSGRKERPSTDFRTVTIQTTRSDGSKTERNNVDNSSDLWPTQPDPGDLNADRIHIVHLRGLLTPSCILDVGSQLKIDPEYFRRHMNVLPQSLEAFDMTTSRSSALKFPCFKINTICGGVPSYGFELDRSRAAERGVLRRHHEYVNSTMIPGDSIARRFLVLDKGLVALEQHVSVSVKHRKDGRCYLIMWFDSGKDVADSSLQGSLHQLSDFIENRTIPVIQHNPSAALHSRRFPYPDAQSSPIFQQSTDFLISNYGVSLDPRLMRIDVMYTLSELLRFCHSSEIQFLNAVESCVRDALQSPNEVVSEASFKNLRYFKDLLDTHVDYLQGTLSFIKEPKDARWPSAKYDADIDVVGQVLSSLLDDYTHTLERAEMMIKRIVEGTEMHANEMMLTESKKAILQAESTTRLTLLAAFFLPINLVTSFFGMNFKQFGQGSLHIWIAFACMRTMLLASSVALVMSKPEILSKPIRRMYRWYRDRKLYGFFGY